jgi:hypothetical protein
MTDGHVWQTLQVHIGAICSHLSCNCRYPAKAMIKKVKSLIYYTLVYQPAAHFWTATRSQKRGFFTPTEVGAHLPTPEGWRAELAQEGRLHQTVDNPYKARVASSSVNSTPAVRIEPRSARWPPL